MDNEITYQRWNQKWKSNDKEKSKVQLKLIICNITNRVIDGPNNVESSNIVSKTIVYEFKLHSSS